MYETELNHKYKKYQAFYDAMHEIKQKLLNRIIPEEYPVGISDWIPYKRENNINRDDYINISSYALVSHRWVKPLSEYVGQAKCLEIMAGRGVLAEALSQHGTSIVATDDFSWNWEGGSRNDTKPLIREDLWFDVEHVNCIGAIEKYGGEVEYIICSWPNMNDSMYDALHKMREINPNCKLIYIGEGEGGFTASDLFFKTAVFINNDQHFDNVAKMYQNWVGVYDRMYLVK